MFGQKKNSYLQLVHSTVNPRLLNRCVAQTRDKRPGDIFDTSPPLNRLASQQPEIPKSQEFDPTKRILPLGRSGIPLLIRDLQHSDSQIVIRTLSTLNELFRDPEKSLEAIGLKIHNRLLTVVPRTEQFIRERACYTYRLLSNYAVGKEAIVSNMKIIELFMDYLKDDKIEVRLNLAHSLERIASFWMTADVLVDAKLIQPIMNRIGADEPEVTCVLLETLSHLMYGNGKFIALEAGAFDLMLQMLDVPDIDVRLGALQCLMMMTTTPLGKQLAAKTNILPILGKMLHEDERLYVNTAGLLSFCTMLSQAKSEAAKIKMIPTRLVRLCKNEMNPDLQLFCLMALTNISEHPDVRDIMKRKHLGRLKRIPVSTDILKKYKNNLLSVVTWDPSVLVCNLTTNLDV